MVTIEIVGGPRDGETFALPEGVNHLTVAKPLGPLVTDRAWGRIDVLTYDLPICRDRRHKDRAPHVHWRER